MEKDVVERVESRLESLLNNGVEKGVFSGVAAGVYRFGKGQEIRVITCHGRTRGDEAGTPINSDTLFDLASLTKPLCTALTTLCLIQRREVDWESCLVEKISFAFQGEYQNITIDHLLTHSAGLIAYKPLYQSFAPVPSDTNQEKIIQALLRENLAYQPGSNCLYSDIGFILLGALIEKVSGTTLDNFFHDEIAHPLHIQEEILFLPMDRKEQRKGNVAATEQCPWRGKMVQGEVHDEHAWLTKGVAGHAGLFGTIGGVMALTEHLLHQWKGRTTHPGFSNQLLQKALTRKYASCSWCRGFDTPAAQGSSAGIYFSPHSVGHLGYTGTSFWIDPEQEIVVVLLSNRVHPSRKNEQIRKFRPLFHNTVLESLQGEGK